MHVQRRLQEHKEFRYGANKLAFHQNKALTEPNNHSEAVKCVVQSHDGSAAEQMYSVENDDQLSPNSFSLFFQWYKLGGKHWDNRLMI